MKKTYKIISMIFVVLLMCSVVICVHASDNLKEKITEEHNTFNTSSGETELSAMASCTCHKPELSVLQNGTCPTCDKTSTYVNKYECKACGRGYLKFECGHTVGLKED